MSNKTAITELFEKYGHLLPDVEDEYKEKERQQHEKTAIDMVNIALDNLGNKNSKMEDKFNKYYSKTFEQWT